VRDPSLLQRILGGRLQPGGNYRVEVTSGALWESGCVRVASPREEAAVHAQLAELRREFRTGAPQDGALRMLEAAMLAQDGYLADALQRLEPVLVLPEPPASALQLWDAIAARAGLPPRGG
jgi:hypothetical protein